MHLPASFHVILMVVSLLVFVDRARSRYQPVVMIAIILLAASFGLMLASGLVYLGKAPSTLIIYLVNIVELAVFLFLCYFLARTILGPRLKDWRRIRAFIDAMFLEGVIDRQEKERLIRMMHSPFPSTWRRAEDILFDSFEQHHSSGER